MENENQIKKELESLMKKESTEVSLTSDKALLRDLLKESKTISENLQDLLNHSKIVNENLESILPDLEASDFDREYNRFDREYNRFDREFNRFDREG